MSRLLVMLLTLGLSLPLMAAEEKKTEAAAETKTETKAVDEADQKVTNRRLRAESGSLSDWSASMYFNYQGGSVDDPTDPARPNIVNGQDALTLQNFYAEIGVRYRATKLDSFTVSTGLFMTTPFHSEIDDNANPALKKNFEDNHQELNIQDPGLKYTHVDNIFNLQSVSTIKGTWVTNNQQQEAGFKSYVTGSQVFMKDIGKSGLSIGGALQATYYDFNKSNQNITNSVVGLYPAAEYVINDIYNVRTVFGWQVYENLRYQDSDTYLKRKVYQSVGLGISLSRDVFLYPNIQYIPSDVRADRTNIAISANVNMF